MGSDPYCHLSESQVETKEHIFFEGPISAVCYLVMILYF